MDIRRLHLAAFAGRGPWRITMGCMVAICFQVIIYTLLSSIPFLLLSILLLFSDKNIKQKISKVRIFLSSAALTLICSIVFGVSLLLITVLHLYLTEDDVQKYRGCGDYWQAPVGNDFLLGFTDMPGSAHIEKDGNPYVSDVISVGKSGPVVYGTFETTQYSIEKYYILDTLTGETKVFADFLGFKAALDAKGVTDVVTTDCFEYHSDYWDGKIDCLYNGLAILSIIPSILIMIFAVKSYKKKAGNG